MFWSRRAASSRTSDALDAASSSAAAKAIENAEAKSETSKIDKIKEEFHRQEYIALRAEILAHNASVLTLAQNSVAATAAFYAFLLAYKPNENLSISPMMVQFAGFIPLMFPFFGGLLSNRLHATMIRIGSYIQCLENEYGLEAFGWEKQFAGPERQETITLRISRFSVELPNRIRSLYGTWASFWILFFGITFAMGSLMALSIHHNKMTHFSCIPTIPVTSLRNGS